MLSRALADLRTRPTGDLEVSVNVAAAQVAPRLVLGVEQTCGATGVDPSRLVLELTETSRIDPLVVGDPLQRLRRLGVRIALDDFGTGWSPLSHLHVLPVDVLKLDRTGPHGRAEDAIARAVTAMAEDLGLQVVAEGIETLAERARMVRFGCRTGQGHLFARPMPMAALAGLPEPTATTRAGVGGREAS